MSETEHPPIFSGFYKSPPCGRACEIDPEYPQYDGLGFDPSNFNLNKNSIGIEIDSWGGLVQDTDGLWYPAKMDRDGNDQIFVPNKGPGCLLIQIDTIRYTGEKP